MIRRFISRLIHLSDSSFKRLINNPRRLPRELVYVYFPGKDPLYFRQVTDIMVDSGEMLERFGTAGRFVYNDTKEVRIATVLIIALIGFLLFLILIPIIEGVLGRLIISLVAGIIFGILPGSYLGKKLATKPVLRLLAQLDGQVHPIIHPTYLDQGYTEIDIKENDGSVSKKTVPQNWKATTLHEINEARDSERYYKTEKTGQHKLEMGLLVAMCIISLILVFLFGTANFGNDSELVQNLPSLSDSQIVENQRQALSERP